MNRSSRRHDTSFLKKSCLSILVAFALSSANAAAQAPDATVQYAISAGDLIQVVNESSRNSGVPIAYDIALLRGLTTRTRSEEHRAGEECISTSRSRVWHDPSK